MTRVGMISLGCSKNLVDSEVMLGHLAEAGYEVTNDASEADVLIVNTCGFIRDAKQESIDSILEMAGYKVTGGRLKRLIVSGCLAERYKEELLREMPEIDGILGIGAVNQIVDIVTRALNGERVASFPPPAEDGRPHPRLQVTPPHTAYLRVSDGCSNRCSYCAIPDIRGGLRSRPIEALVRDAEAMAERGVRELILVAQDLTAYGLDLYGRDALPELVGRLAGFKAFKWIRLMYCYPTRVSERLIDVMSREPSVCRYIDIPLQHASPDVLKRMNRPSDPEAFASLIGRLRSALPGIAVRTTFLVGFPGETEDDFRRLLEFISRMRFDRAGVFEYSREEGTPAAEFLPQVPRSVKRERVKRAVLLQKGISREINESMVGEEIETLIESVEPSGTCVGRTYRDAPEVDGRIFVKGCSASPGSFVKVKVTGASNYDLAGEASCVP